MKIFIPNEDAVIEQQLRDHDHDRDLKWVRERLEKAEEKLEIAEEKLEKANYAYIYFIINT